MRNQWTACLTVGVLSLLFLNGAKSGCGSEEGNETLMSPVQAVASVLERADGTVDAQLVLISTAANPHAFVETALNARIRVPDGTEVDLVSQGAGHYVADSGSSPKLVYAAGEKYQFRFELDDEAAAKQVAGGTFVAIVQAPDDTVDFSLSTPPDFAGDTAEVSWTPGNRFGLLDVRDAAGELTYSTFDFSDANFDGSKWARFKKGGTLALSVDTFPEPGEYTLTFCAVDKVSDFDKELSAELGALSGFLAGRCDEDVTVTVLP